MTKLTIELVPSTCWYSNVRSEVSKEDWDKIKTQSYKKAGYRCEICGGKGDKWPVECHEIWHYNDKKKIQTLKGLISLCPSCHEVKHIGLAGIKGRREIAMKHLAKVNDWDEETTEKYVKKAFEIYKERSNHQWTLDITKLNELIDT